jgi:hypothetical protein
VHVGLSESYDREQHQWNRQPEAKGFHNHSPKELISSSFLVPGPGDSLADSLACNCEVHAIASSELRYLSTVILNYNTTTHVKRFLGNLGRQAILIEDKGFINWWSRGHQLGKGVAESQRGPGLSIREIDARLAPG